MREPKKVPLDVQDRLMVFQLLPEKSSFSSMTLIRELREALELKPEEQEKVDWVLRDDGAVQWNIEKGKALVAEIPFDPKMFVVVMEALQKLDKDEELEARHLSLYEKFVVCEKDSKVAGSI